MKKLSIVLILTLLAAMLSMTPAGAVDGKKSPPGLDPGKYIVFNQEVPINLVFVGYEPDMIDGGELESWLPGAYDPIVRYPYLYGLEGRPMGLHFDFTYNTIYAPQQFEDRFFKYLQKIGVPGDPTLYQLNYNDMANNVLDVTGPVLYIDGPSVEKYLSQALPGLGVNVRRGYTIFLVNWFSRPDFQFHVYTKTDVVDPDTGYNFGEARASRKMIAWGGSYSRTWFYDLSAGPESWSGNYDVDNPDVDGDGEEDYRMPPVWEYFLGGYHAGFLSQDLGLVTRLVAIDLLFTTSPLYDPLNTAPQLGGQKVAHIEVFEDDPASSGLDWISSAFALAGWAKFEPYYNWEVNLEDNNPVDAAAQRAFRIWAELLTEDDCWSGYGTPFAELFCFFDLNYSAYIPDYDPEDNVSPFLMFNTTADNMGPELGLLGYADDDWVSGKQTYVFGFDTDYYRSIGYGFSTTTLHEGGHHFGMSHPHDGYDPEWDLDYGPSGSTYFAWSGDESNTIMHYMDLSDEFGKFDQDNMYRYEFAGYMNWANELLGRVMDARGKQAVRPLLLKAKVRAAVAERAFERWDYLKAVTDAHAAYLYIVQAAQMLGVDTTPASAMLRAIPGGVAPHEGDPIRFPDN